MGAGPSEVRLSGGTLSSVVRVGDTVRRTARPWTPAVHDLLRHIRAQGFDLAPEPLGFDESGREMLRYIPGETVGWSIPWPGWVRTDEMLEAVGLATAAYHAAVAGFGWAGLGAGQIVCHNDLAPYNMVFRSGRLSGVIDWDLVGPGAPVWDLAFVAWQWVPLHGPFVAAALGWSEPVDRPGRLRRLLDAYGLSDRTGFIGTVADRIRYNRALMLDRAAAGDAAYRALVEQGHVAGMDEALAYVEAEAEALQEGL